MLKLQNIKDKPITPFEGVIVRFIYRDEKTGACKFVFKTKMEILIEEAIDRTIIKNNSFTSAAETWNYIICDASEYRGVSIYSENYPIIVKGFFDYDSYSGKMVLKAANANLETQDQATLVDYLTTLKISRKKALLISEKIFELQRNYCVIDFFKRKDILDYLVKCNLTNQEADLLIAQVFKTIYQREVFEVIAPFGGTFSQSAKIVKNQGTQAVEKLLNDPYSICYFAGISFRVADQLASLRAFSYDSKCRLSGAVLYGIHRVMNAGSTYVMPKDFQGILYQMINDEAFFQKNSNIMTASVSSVESKVALRWIKNRMILATNEMFESERQSAFHLKRIALSCAKTPFTPKIITEVEAFCGIHYGLQQKKAMEIILSQRGFAILTGGPGTGKTSTVKGILHGYQKMYPEHKIKLCAPTGRAAQRMSESTEMEAVTVHRLLGYTPYGNGSIVFNQENPIDADFIIMDEVSMLDTQLFSLFLNAVSTGTMVLFVGDPDQLESVGPGAVLRDLLQVPYSLIRKSHLSEVFRQKEGSPIIDNAIRINTGNRNLIPHKDFEIIETRSEQELLDTVKKIMKQSFQPADPFYSQILCPSTKGKAGIHNINQELQALLNPTTDKGLRFGGVSFKKNDKIIMTHNNYDLDYFNGDIGTILEITKDRKIMIQIGERKILLNHENFDDISLAYSMTIHKSQGSEFPIAIIVIPKNPKNMLVRNLIYTAVTRAKKKVFLISEESAYKTAISRCVLSKRKTLFLDLLDE